jgi:hypothetical protein
MTDVPMPTAKIRCDACPVMCYIAEGNAGACDRYANHQGALVRLDPITVLESGRPAVAFLDTGTAPEDWDGDIIRGDRTFLTAVGAGTTYPDYKPAPFIVSQEVRGVDMVTVVTEGIFSYCGVQVKIDTDRHIGPEGAIVRCEGEAVGLVITGEYGSRMLSLGGVDHLTGGSKKEGRVTCDALLRLCNRQAVELTIDGGATVVVQAGKAPVVNGCRGTHAGGLRVGHHRHLCQAMGRAGRRGGGGRRPHHRRAVGTPGGQAAGHAAETGIKMRGRRNPRRGAISRWPNPAPAGAAPTFPTRCHPAALRCQGGLAGPAC